MPQLEHKQLLRHTMHATVRRVAPVRCGALGSTKGWPRHDVPTRTVRVAPAGAVPAAAV